MTNVIEVLKHEDLDFIKSQISDTNFVTKHEMNYNTRFLSKFKRNYLDRTVFYYIDCFTKIYYVQAELLSIEEANSLIYKCKLKSFL